MIKDKNTNEDYKRLKGNKYNMTMNIKQLMIVGLLYLVIFFFGYWIGHADKPYNTVMLAIHKLVSVAAMVFLIIIFIRRNQVGALNMIELTLVLVTGLFFLCTIITGGLLSTHKPMPPVVFILHQVTPYLTVLFTAITLYLLLTRKQ